MAAAVVQNNDLMQSMKDGQQPNLKKAGIQRKGGGVRRDEGESSWACGA